MDEHKEQEAISLLKMIYVQIGQIDKYIYMFKDSYNHYIINIEKNTTIKLDKNPWIVKLKSKHILYNIQFEGKKAVLIVFNNQLIAFVNNIHYTDYNYELFELDNDNIAIIYNYISEFNYYYSTDTIYVDIIDPKQQKVVTKYRKIDYLDINEDTIKFCDFNKKHFKDKDIMYDKVILNIKKKQEV